MEFKIRVDHYFHSTPTSEPEAIKLLKEIFNQNKTIMGDIAKFESALNRIDAATTKIAEQLRDLKDQLTNAGLPADLEAQVLTRLETSATQLEAVGQSVENPAPEIPAVEG